MSNQTIIITGASGSLGSAVVTKILPLEANLVLISRSIEKNEELLTSFNYPNSKYLVLAGDVSSEDSIQSFVSRTKEKFTHIDVLIHIAGTYKGGKPLYESDTTLWDTLFDLNAKSLFLLAKSIVPIMLEQKSGIIISVASKSAFDLSPNSGIYAASKNVTVKLTQTLAKELIHTNIRVNTILPSIIDTEPNRKDKPKNAFSHRVKPESIAYVIEFLLSDKARDITGAAIPVYGKLL